MKIIESLKGRRSYYSINRDLPVSIEEVINKVEEITELVPDAFNMKSSKIVVVYGEKQDLLWNTIYDVFEGKVARSKIDSFQSGFGTILYFYDSAVVENLQKQFPRYADNFPVWANQASGMLQFSIWSGLRELGIGASLQHYNPVIDKAVKELFNIPDGYVLVAEMPFGGILEEPEPKDKEDIKKRVISF